MPERRQPGGERLSEGDDDRLRVRRFDALDLVIGVGRTDCVARRDVHLVGEDEVIGRDRLTVGPDDVVAQSEGQRAAVLGDAAVLGRGDFRHEDGDRLQVFVKVPGPGVPQRIGDGGKPHAGIEWAEGIELLRPDERGDLAVAFFGDRLLSGRLLGRGFFDGRFLHRGFFGGRLLGSLDFGRAAGAGTGGQGETQYEQQGQQRRPFDLGHFSSPPLLGKPIDGLFIGWVRLCSG